MQIDVEIAEGAVEVDLAVFRLELHVDAARHFDRRLDRGELLDPPAARVRSEVAADGRFVAVYVNAGRYVIDDSLLLVVAVPPVVVALRLAAHADHVPGAVDDPHL